MENKINEQKENPLIPILKGKTYREAELLLREALRIIQLNATIN
jgi:hypothetical protein